LPDFSGVPSYSIAADLIMTAIVAGVVEEIAFRGYIQAPTERAYGPSIAILITTFYFCLAHANKIIGAWPLVFYYAAASLIVGLLAYLTNSIVPGIIIHTTFDAARFLVLWQFPPLKVPRSEESIAFYGVLFVVLLVASIFCFRRLALLNRHVIPSAK
jgi:membrane protease YdiL (CAAX protease family)